MKIWNYESVEEHNRQAGRPAGLLMFPVRCSFLNKSSHAFLLIFSGEEGLEYSPFKAQSFFEAELIRCIHRFLRHTHCKKS